MGSIFRTADAGGVSDIFICGVTPDPIDRFGRKRADLAKVALGAEDSVSWRHVSSTEEAILILKKQGFTIVALEQGELSINYSNLFSKLSFEKTALVLGEETKGISPHILELTDHIAEIPMSGEKESLNVSVSAGIAIFSFRDSKN